MSFLPVAATVFALILFAIFGDTEAAIVVALLVAVIALQWLFNQKTRALSREIDELRQQLARLSNQTLKVNPEEPGEETSNAPPKQADVLVEQPERPTSDFDSRPAALSIKPQPSRRVKNPFDHFEELLRRIAGHVASYFTDGNLFVRIGILILFFGVAFLLKYAAENSKIPIEFRFIGAAAGGLAVLVFGWRIRFKKPVYGLLLQGAGIGILYITIFAAYQLAELLPPTLTFVLLVLFSAFTVLLAVLQDSRALAIAAVVGGFLAPILASSGSGNFIGLFSYYALLNAVIISVAWRKAWRLLNLFGFIFTFGVYTLWLVSDYSNADLWPAIGFVLLFFVIYSLIGVLYAYRQPERLTGLVDGTLVFGTPLIVSSLMMVMLRHHDYGIAGASAGLGMYYVLLARFCWHRAGAELRLISEAMLAIGVVFATLAIPYSLDGHWSTATWALEAAGILWVSIRQNRFYAQCFAIVLQIGAGVLFVATRVDNFGSSMLMNPAFLGGVFIALGAFVSARLLYLQAPEFKLRPMHIFFFAWAMGWWLVTALLQIDTYIQDKTAAWLLLFTATASALVYLDRLRAWNWLPASFSALLLLPCLIVIALHSVDSYGHVLASPNTFIWLAVLMLNYWLITRLETVNWPKLVSIGQHGLFVVFITLLFSLEISWLLDKLIASGGEGLIAISALFPILVIHIAKAEELPAIKRFGQPLQLGIIASLVLILGLWSLLINISNSGDPAPLPYIPFLNPVDLAQLVLFITIAICLRELPAITRPLFKVIVIATSILAFVWLTAVLIRSMHHYADIPFKLYYLLSNTAVQTAISILWTIIGMAAMLFASRKIVRTLWISGAVLIAVVLVKMIFVDLGASGTVERIVSFLVVGSLLVAMGYFSPIPDSDKESDPHGSKHAKI